MFWNKYPSTDMHELNLDWILAEIKKLHSDWSDFKILNSIRFYGEHDITKGYPAWALVSHDNIGYISTQIVPAGIDLDNMDYWKPVADYSALLADMQERITKIENIITNFDDHVNITGDSIIIGDSYADRPNSWGIILGRKLSEYGNCYQAFRGGVGFTTQPTVGHSFLTLLLSLESQILLKNNIKNIIVCGGYNDYESDKNTIIANILSFSTYVSNTYINAKIHIGFLGWDITPDRFNVKRKLLEVVEPSYKLARANNLRYIGNYSYILHNNTFVDDSNFHPNELGSEAFSEVIYQGLQGYTNTNFVWTNNTNITPSGVTTSIDGNNLRECLDNNIYTLSLIPMGNETPNINFNVNMPDDRYRHEIGTLKLKYASPTVLVSAMTVETIVGLFITNVGVVTYPARLSIQSDKLYIELLESNDLGTITSIGFSMPQFNIPYIYC